MRDKLNKNYNAMVKKACQELENKLRKIASEGGKITQAQLMAAILSLKTKLQMPKYMYFFKFKGFTHL